MSFSSGGEFGAPMAEINVTPLVDVMLVLLIIFMITAPLMSHKIKVELPQADLDKKPETKDPVPPITLSITEDGAMYWNDMPITKAKLESELSVIAQQTPQPSINVRGDTTTKYGVLNEAVKIAQSQGMRKVGFVAIRERPQ